MKKILFLLALFSALKVEAQNSDNTNLKIPLDINGMMVTGNLPLLQNPTILSATTLTAYNYDSVRALSELNTSIADAYPYITADGLRLYYTNGSGVSSNSLMFAQRSNVNSYFSTPVNIPLPSSANNSVSFWLSNDELDLYVCMGSTLTLYYLHRVTTTSSFGTATIITLSGLASSFYAGASLNNAQDELFLYVAVSGIGHIAVYQRTSSSSFSFVRFMPLPSGFISGPGQLSKDDLTFFLSASTTTTPKSSIYQYTRTTPSDSFDVATFQQVQGINDVSMYNIQPSMSDSLNWVAFVRGINNIWTDNDLYLAHKGSITSVFNPDDYSATVDVYPVPAINEIIITVAEANDLWVQITDARGCILKTVKLNSKKTKIELTGLPKGIYQASIKSNKGITTKKIVKL